MRRAIMVAAGQHHALAILGIASPPFSRPAAKGGGCKTSLDDPDQRTTEQNGPTTEQDARTVPTLRSLCEAKAQEMVELGNLSSCLAFAQVLVPVASDAPVGAPVRDAPLVLQSRRHLLVLQSVMPWCSNLFARRHLLVLQSVHASPRRFLRRFLPSLPPTF